MTLTIPNHGGYSWSIAYVGAVAEIVVDTDNHDLLIHDGVTVGGFRIMSVDNANARYQERIPELAGFANFPPVAKGIPFRTDVGQYRIGQIAGTGAIQVTNGNGVAGNPTITLKSVIDSSHTFTGAITFNQAIAGVGGFTGNLTGNVAGNLSGNVTGNLTGDATGDHSGTFTGALDVRGEQLFFDANQIPLGAVNGLISALSGVALPTGIIMLWSGEISAIPSGWLLCDGLNGTPDLRDRFIVGAGDTFDPHDTFGSDVHSHVVTLAAGGDHSHPVTVDGHILTIPELPAHTHGSGVTDAGTDVFNHGSIAANPTTNDSIENNGANGINEAVTTSVGGGQAHSHTASSTASGSHTHVATVADSAALPPSYALAYIMKG